MAVSLAVSLVALAAYAARVSAVASNADTSLTLLYQNNFNAADDKNHIGEQRMAQILGHLLLISFRCDSSRCEHSERGQGSLRCYRRDFAYPECNQRTPVSYLYNPWLRCSYVFDSADFSNQLGYVAYAGRAPAVNAYFIDSGVVSVDDESKTLDYPSVSAYKNYKLPVLCTQSSQESQPNTAVATSKNQIAVRTNTNTYVGFRNQKSFRFLGIRYADTPARFEHSKVYSGVGKTFDATAFGPQCPQYGSGAEDCLILNIQTPYIPKSGSTSNLRPVMFWIHGGGFTGTHVVSLC
jgi:hypothetical protein